MSKISVIVPIYNTEQYLSRCINSIINQSYKDLEIILVNDGSTDNSAIICNKFAINDSRIKVINKINGGQSDARNVGLSIATGEYISFIDSDDWINEDMYFDMINVMKKEKSDICICGMYAYYNDKDIKRDSNISYVQMNNSQAMLNHLNRAYICNISPCNKVYSSHLFESIRFPINKLYEDTFTTYKLFALSNKVIHIGKAYYFHFQRDGSTTHRNFDEKYIHLVMAYIEIHDFIKEKYPDLIIYSRSKLVINAVEYLHKNIYERKVQEYSNDIELVRSILVREKIVIPLFHKTTCMNIKIMISHILIKLCFRCYVSLFSLRTKAFKLL